MSNTTPIEARPHRFTVTLWLCTGCGEQIKKQDIGVQVEGFPTVNFCLACVKRGVTEDLRRQLRENTREHEFLARQYHELAERLQMPSSEDWANSTL